MVKKYAKNVKDYVGASVMLGTGATVLGGMGQGYIATKAITPATGMFGAVGTAMGARAVMDIVTPKKKARKKKKK